jgi:hypothetical protein
MPASEKEVPQFFRLNVEVGNLEEAIHFYSTLLGVEGRKQPGSRVYYECGPVTLQVVDVSSVREPHIAAKALYFTVKDLEAIFERAKVARESCRASPYMMHQVAALWYGRGASARSTWKIRGKSPVLRCRKEPFIQVESLQVLPAAMPVAPRCSH